MITINNKQYNNLQEQVLQNQNDIAAIISGNVVLGELGIKVVGQGEDTTALPNPDNYTGDYGDAYLIGTETPYDYYIFTRPFQGQTTPQWFNLGKFPLAGPKGDKGAVGVTPSITIGSVLTGDEAAVTISGTPEAPILNLTLPRGLPGEPGANGTSCTHYWQGTTLYVTSASGTSSANLKGEPGTPSVPVRIVGEVLSVDGLPTPTEATRTEAYIVHQDNSKHLYAVVGDIYLYWVDCGELAGGGSAILVNGQEVTQWNADTKVDVVVDQNIVYGMDSNGLSTTYKVDDLNYPDTFDEGNIVRRTDSFGDIRVSASPATSYSAVSSSHFINTLYGTYISYLMNKIYPVGSIYTSLSDTDPSNLFGVGIWQPISGKFLVGYDENDSTFSMAGMTGGSKDATLPEHRHLFKGFEQDLEGWESNSLFRYDSNTSYRNPAFMFGSYGTNSGYIALQYEGENPTNKNLPPYMIVYMWRRIG